jgi:hypothetical protein
VDDSEAEREPGSRSTGPPAGRQVMETRFMIDLRPPGDKFGLPPGDSQGVSGAHGAAMADSRRRPGKRLIFRRWYIHPKTGRRVYPQSGSVFPIWVDD